MKSIQKYLIIFLLIFSSCIDPSKEYERKGDYFLSKQEYANAIEQYLEAVNFNPYNYTAFCSLGQAYEDAGYSEKAMGYYDKAINVNPDYADGYMT